MTVSTMLQHVYRGLLTIFFLFCGSVLAQAQVQGSGNEDDQAADSSPEEIEEIITTARKREESITDVPVAISVLTGERLDNLGLTDLGNLTSYVPELNVSVAGVKSGGALFMRGIGSYGNSSSIDQAVSVNLDGVPVSYGGVLKLGQFDVGQIEILKGPQALFFGKNATGGIISINSAAPTDELSFMARAEYEIEEEQFALESRISGPLSDNARGRLAVRYSDEEGRWDNIIIDPGSGALVPGRDVGAEEILFKGVLEFEPSDTLSVKLVGAHASLDGDNPDGGQRYSCPAGAPQGPLGLPLRNDCELDDSTQIPDLDPALNAVDARFPSDGKAFMEIDQSLFVAKVTYDLSESLTLTSITGYYDLEFDAAGDATPQPINLIVYSGNTSKSSFTQELRLATQSSGPVNGMIGIFYQDDDYHEDQITGIVPFGLYFPSIFFDVDTETVSPFVQMDWDVSDRLTLSGGVRYTKEEKSQRSDESLPGRVTPEIEFSDVSPELSVMYSLNDSVNLQFLRTGNIGDYCVGDRCARTR